jgi:hypothetical protein
VFCESVRVELVSYVYQLIEDGGGMFMSGRVMCECESGTSLLCVPADGSWGRDVGVGVFCESVRVELVSSVYQLMEAGGGM